MTSFRNSITIKRRVDNFTVLAVATYLEAEDGWSCRCSMPGGYKEQRNPYETGMDVWATLTDMIDLALAEARTKARA